MKRVAALVLVASFAVGCSSIPKAAAMRPDDVTRAGAWNESLELHVSGGQDFDFRVSDATFAEALREALAESGVAHRLVESGGTLRLDVVLGDDAGLEGRELGVLWSLSRGGETVWQQLVRSKGKSFQLVGVTRLRRSVEMAAQENIRLGIEALSRVDPEDL